ncbi:hypothetical protein AcW1_005026 [Taiwanofungus camphoratus]|nr:hypothetical protein AcW2_005965 [Antrodia cinnamomea]KAI0940256.1 hypothetical protein AcV5_001411 [Antrodia cinnamomea]KAI0941196.1 hypothetical protein AcV7_002832 [Antrodia cinnamomea]KAI0960540.1 hypothetical protein AcW1_005026 [Antrodia cinnamomea]
MPLGQTSPAMVPHWKNSMEGVQSNLSPETVERMVEALSGMSVEGEFGYAIETRLKTKELFVNRREEDGKLQARVVHEITVSKDMLNAADSIHGGCIAYLIDICSSVPLSLIGIVTNGAVFLVSQAINTIYHGGSGLGAKLKITSMTTAVGGRVMSARTEIWDVTNQRLVASGTHVKMQPSVPRPKL